MCSTLQQHLLTKPCDDLPASCNGPLLHLLEAFRQCKADKEDLERKLATEIECHQADLDELHRVVISSSMEKSDRLPDEDSRVSSSAANQEGPKSSEGPSGKPIGVISPLVIKDAPFQSKESKVERKPAGATKASYMNMLIKYGDQTRERILFITWK